MSDALDGVLLVDKERGPSSHDVVAQARRALGTREVGHAGTLDPMATGLLVVLVGTATRLSSYATREQKSYEATVRLGALTDTLDAEGSVLREAPVPEGALARAEGALRAMVGPLAQVPPAVSAIKQGGVRAYEKARAGEAVELAPRAVELLEAEVLALREAPPEVELRVRVSKGFYVRSLARDLGEALGTLGYLTALRRLSSGGFEVRDAAPGTELREAARGDKALRERVRSRVLPLVEAAACMMPVLRWGAEQERAEARARALWQGKQVPLEEGEAPREGEATLVLWGARPVCVAEAREGRWVVRRGFAPSAQ